MPYWEIWNEPDLDPDDSPNKRCWGGTKAEFFDFYEIVSKHLKKCFPHLKIGGPALACNMEWAEDFLSEMKKRNAPLDFFSWHIYGTDPLSVKNNSLRVRALLEKYGFGGTESILNEWNYVKGWTDKFIDSLKTIHSMKGAAFVMAVISLAQSLPIDMLMYYDTRPSTFNGVFDFYTCEPLKTYFALKWFGMFYGMENEIRAEAMPENVYSLCGCDKDGRLLAVFTYYNDEENLPDIDLEIDFGRSGNFEVFLLDENHDAEKIGETENTAFTLKHNTCIMLKEV